MVTWVNSSMETTNELDQIWEQLNREVADNPSFEEVAGIKDVALADHTKRVVASYMAGKLQENPASLLDPDQWLFVYAMGFIVGTRYERKHPHMRTKD